MTAPTEAEIRALIESKSKADFGAQIFEITGPVDYFYEDDPPREGPEDGLWHDLRPSQQRRLRELLNGIYDLADEYERRVVDATVQAVLTFAAEYPDAPRAKELQPAQNGPGAAISRA